MACKTRKKSYGSQGGNGLVIFLLLIIVAGGVYIYMDAKGGEVETNTDTTDSGSEDLDPVDVGDDFGAEVNENGECVSREGIETGLCCATWDSEAGELKWVLCEDLAEQDATQAFFSFNDGDTLENMAAIMFSVKLTNTGNAPADVKISDVQVTNVSGGDIDGVAEIQSAFESLMGEFQTVPTGNAAQYNMNTDNYIRLDVPEGTDAYQMTDGIYEITLSLSVMDEQGHITDGGSRTVQMDVSQENIQFAIDVSQL